MPVSCGLVEIMGPEQFQAGLGIFHRVERQRRMVAGETFAVGHLGLAFLQMGRVGQEDFAERLRRRGGMDRPMKALPRQQRQIARMVDMRMRQQDEVDLGGRNRQGLPVALAQLFEALEQAAIDQDAAPVRLDEVFRAGHRADPAEESDLVRHVPAFR